MRKIMVLAFGLVLIVTATAMAIQPPGIEINKADVSGEAKKIAESFSKIVLDKISDKAGVLENDIEVYFLNMAVILISGGLEAKEAEEVIDRSLPLYEIFLAEIIDGNKPDPYINTYIDRVQKLLKEFGFNNDDTGKLLILIKDHFFKLWESLGR